MTSDKEGMSAFGAGSRVKGIGYRGRKERMTSEMELAGRK
jgi:hypothetical protein